MTPALYVACPDAMHVITADGRILRAGRAAMFILEEVGYPPWLIRPLTWPPLVWFTESGYQLIARNRWLASRFLFTKE